jgi:hypothetical protein
MITLTDREAEDIRLALNLGQTSFCRDEGLMTMTNEEANEYLEEDSPTKRLLFSVLRGNWIMLNKIEAERGKDQSPVGDRFEILDL